MKWTKASEPPKERMKNLIVKCENKAGDIYNNVATYDPEKIYAGSNWDVDNVIEWLDESPSGEAQAEWEFLTIIKANRAILKNAENKVAFPTHSAKSAALEVYDDMIEIISNLPAKRSGKEKQVADYINKLSSPSGEQGVQDELWDDVTAIVNHAGVPLDVLKSKYLLIKK